MTGKCFVGGLLDAAAKAPDAVAVEVLEEGRSFTYADLLAHAERMRGLFISLGISRGEAVLLMLPPGVETIAALYALASLGAIVVPAPPVLTSFELRPMLADAPPVGIVTTQARLEAPPASLLEARHLRFALAVDGEPDPKAFAREPPERAPRLLGPSALTADRSPLEPPAGNPSFTCHFTYKGLGYPLGALHRYHDYTAQLDALRACFPQEPGAAHLAVLPLYPIFGLAVSLMLPFSERCRVVLATDLKRWNLVELLVRHRIRCAALVPPLLRRIPAQARALGEHPLEKDLILYSAASTLDPSVSAGVVASIGVEPTQGYGLTETLIVTCNRTGRARSGTCGPPLVPEFEVAIHDSFSREVPAGRAGEIAVRDPIMMEGFIARPRETARFLRDGWFKTGDLGMMDEDGFLHFLGRAAPIAKIAARMVDLVEIESVVREHPAVADARARVRTDPEQGDQIAVSVVLKRRASVLIEELHELCQTHLSPHKLPRRFKIYQRHLAEVPLA